MSLQAGELLQDRYRIVRTIKSGGMGCVYEAQDTKLADSPCAVKEIHEAAQASKDAEYIQGRFYEEMKALAALDHPGIPKVRDFSRASGSVFIVMDLVKGRSLEEELQERQETGGEVEVEAVVQDMLLLLDILDYLHQQDTPIVHRDVKPANILRDPRKRGLKLVDFGLARSVQDTCTQTIVGTLGFCAPEQLMGRSEPRSDLYSAGATFARLLTGAAPAVELYSARTIHLPHARPGLEAIVEKATQPLPADRYASAAAMAEDLRNWLQGAPVQLTAPEDSQPAAASDAPPPQPTLESAALTPASSVLKPAEALLPPVPLPEGESPSPAHPVRRVAAGVVDLVFASLLGAFLHVQHFPLFLVAYHGVLRLRTPGRSLLGVFVVDRSGQPPSLGRTLLRILLSPFSLLLLGAGFWMSLRDPERRSLHDRLPQTLVYSGPPPALKRSQQILRILALVVLGSLL